MEAKAELAFEGAGGYDFRNSGGWLGEIVLSMDEVLFFDPTLQVVVGGGFEGDEDGSDNRGSRPTGTRFNN